VAAWRRLLPDPDQAPHPDGALHLNCAALVEARLAAARGARDRFAAAHPGPLATRAARQAYADCLAAARPTGFISAQLVALRR
jgi:hypothetical protein